jgi:predicted dinucleotide-binding enzyme
MKIATIGKGNVGGGLAKRWRAAGHDVTEIGSEGGDVSGTDAVLVAVPSNAIADALGKVTGLDGQVVIDATNAFTGRTEGFESLAHEIKSHVNGPVAKSFNCNFAALYDEIAAQEGRPCNLYAAEDGAVEITRELIHDAGYEPISLGGLGSARMLEEHLGFMMAIVEGGLGRFFYRYAKPGEL